MTKQVPLCGYRPSLSINNSLLKIKKCRPEGLHHCFTTATFKETFGNCYQQSMLYNQPIFGTEHMLLPTVRK